MPAFSVFMRFLHIVSAITLLGGVLAWRFAAIPAGADVDGRFALAWRPFALFSIAGLLISGLYNFLNKTGLPPAYHALIGIKILLALHVFAVTFLATRPNNAKRARQLTGVAISGVVIVILSAVLRGMLIV